MLLSCNLYQTCELIQKENYNILHFSFNVPFLFLLFSIYSQQCFLFQWCENISVHTCFKLDLFQRLVFGFTSFIHNQSLSHVTRVFDFNVIGKFSLLSLNHSYRVYLDYIYIFIILSYSKSPPTIIKLLNSLISSN